MRIVIDMQGVQTESRFRGIGRYTLSLVKAIVANRKEHEVVLVLNGLFPEAVDTVRAEFGDILGQENVLVWHAAGPVLEMETGNSWRREAAEFIREAFIASLQPDVVFNTSMFEGFVDDAVTSVGKFDKKTPVCTSLYDLIPLLNSDQYLKPNPAYEKHYLRKIEFLEQSSLLLSISEFTQHEGREHLGSNSNTIVNISTAADEHFCLSPPATDRIRELRSRFGIVRSFLLHTGGADERKNLHRLIRAFAALPKELKDTHQLVLAGRIAGGSRLQLQEQANSVGLDSDELVLTGYITEDELVDLYNMCELHIFPSWHEGFGLPALEAMSCGAPTIGANITSLPEVIGNQDALFDPYSEVAMVQKIKRVLTDESFRNRLVSFGLKQAENFSWDKSAKRAIKAFEQFQEKKTPNNHSISLISQIANIRTTDRPSEADLVETARCIDQNVKSSLRYKNTLGALTWRIEGPFDSTYSLALLNRETALSLDSLDCDVALFSTEGPGDFEPDSNFLNSNPNVANLYSKSREIKSYTADVTSRMLYPPRVNDMESQIRMLHHYAWEETGFPFEWVADFNLHLDGMTCLSSHVLKIMIDNGIHVPMRVTGCGVDHWERIDASKNYKIKAKEFKFLHVSSCFPRKGVDVLLKAYGNQFTSNDDVSLIIKTFSNPHNEIHKWIKDAEREYSDYPNVVVIEEDLSDPDLKALYEQCDVLVAPSCAEGFGLPLAEAMLSGVAVITTDWSGQLDFCNSENSWLVDFEFERAQTHFNGFLSAWAKPKVDELAKAMVDAYSSTPMLRSSMAKAGRALLMEKFKWGDVVGRFMIAVDDILKIENSVQPKIAWISTWNVKCGIAAYSAHLIKNIPSDDVFVYAPYDNNRIADDLNNCKRSWSFGKEKNDFHKVVDDIEKKSINTVVIQFNYGFFNHVELSDFIEKMVVSDRNVIITFHSTVDPEGDDRLPENNYKLQFIVPYLRLCHRILVHSVADLNRLKNIGLVENVALFPHGVLSHEDLTRSTDTTTLPMIASYGYCLPHKGLEELIDAVAILRDQGTPVRLRLVNAEFPAPQSKVLVSNIQEHIKKFKLEKFVEFNSKFLDDSESLELLSEATLIVFAYQMTGESASGAVRYGLATKCPVAVTPLSIFDDISGATFRLPGTDAASIATGVAGVLKSLAANSEEAQNVREMADRWRQEFDYSGVGKRLYGICSALIQQRTT